MMSRLEALKVEIETERRKLDEMLYTMTMEQVLPQSRKLDGLMEEYITIQGRQTV